MKLWLLAVAVLAAVPKALGQDASSALQAVAEMPKCARECLATSVSQSSCQLTNTTCVCTNPTLHQNVQACVAKACTITEALSTMNLTAVACGQPFRDRSRTYVAVNNILSTIAGLFVLQRLGYKVWTKMDLVGDDWVAFVTILVGTPSTIIGVYFVTHNGLGRDIWTLTSSEITRFFFFFWLLEALYFIEICLGKLALLLFYVRIFSVPTVRRLLWGTFIGTVLYGVAFVIVSIFQCTPVDYYWHQWDGVHKGKCLDINSITWSNAAISIAIDIWVLAVPLWQLKSLKLDWRRKIGVGLMFCVGTFVTIVSILRLQTIIQFRAGSLNPTWDYFDVSIWSVVEINVGLICICLPSFRVLLVRLFPKLQGTTEQLYGRSSRHAHRLTDDKRPKRLPLGHSTASQVERINSYPDAEPNGILYQKSFRVEYGDSNDIHLVAMDNKSNAKSEVRPAAR
ncbi:putative PTH11-type G-protein coupled receptor protein [Trichoderma evansii]